MGNGKRKYVICFESHQRLVLSLGSIEGRGNEKEREREQKERQNGYIAFVCKEQTISRYFICLNSMTEDKKCKWMIRNSCFKGESTNNSLLFFLFKGSILNR